jgi:chromosome segregation ATPase
MTGPGWRSLLAVVVIGGLLGAGHRLHRQEVARREAQESLEELRRLRLEIDELQERMHSFDERLDRAEDSVRTLRSEVDEIKTKRHLRRGKSS